MKTKFPLPCFTFPMVYPLNKVLKEHTMHKISVKKKQVHAKPWPKKFTKIDHFHIDHNAHSTVARGQFSNFFDAMLYILFPYFLVFYPAQGGHRICPVEGCQLGYSRARRTAANSFKRGIDCFFRSATRDFEATKQTPILPSG